MRRGEKREGESGFAIISAAALPRPSPHSPAPPRRGVEEWRKFVGRSRCIFFLVRVVFDLVIDKNFTLLEALASNPIIENLNHDKVSSPCPFYP